MANQRHFPALAARLCHAVAMRKDTEAQKSAEQAQDRERMARIVKEHEAAKEKAMSQIHHATSSETLSSDLKKEQAANSECEKGGSPRTANRQ